nr:hypothetical protein [Tanacetum cinerariifolium]
MGCAEEIENMLEIKVYEAGSQKEIFSSEAWRRVFDINQPIYIELCHEYYSTYEFDEFARRLGLYYSQEINEEDFDVYFQGSLSGDENFNAKEYWLNISRDEELQLSRSLALTIKSLILLIPEDPAPEMPRVAIPIGLRPSMQDLYDQMGSMEIRQGAIERMAYRQSYH